MNACPSLEAGSWCVGPSQGGRCYVDAFRQSGQGPLIHTFVQCCLSRAWLAQHQRACLYPQSTHLPITHLAQ